MPITERRAVRASASMATSKSAMENSACWASTTCVKIVAFTLTTTLSLVMTSWRSPGRGISRMSTALQRVDERDDDHQAGIVGAAVLAEPLDHADLALLDDVDHLAQGRQQDQDQQAQDDQRHDAEDAHDVAPSAPSGAVVVGGGGRGRRARAPGQLERPSTEAADSGHTHSVVPRTAVTTTAVPAGSTSPLPLTASQRSPARRT